MIYDVQQVAMERRQDEAMRDALLTASASGAASGGIIGGIGSMLAGGRTPGAIGKAAALGAGLTGGLVGASTHVGQEIMGPPEPSESSPYTRRGLIGGLLGGGAIGAGLGGAIGSGLMGRFKPLARMGGAIAQKIPTENLIGDAMKRFMGQGGLRGAGKGAALGGGILGATGAAYASDEGMQLDWLRDEIDRAAAKRRAEAGGLDYGSV